MSQRNFMNERYNDEKRSGKTRKSASSAKPKAQRAATVRDPAPKTKKQKKQERRERERKAEERASSMLQGRYEDTEGYKRLRRIWWACLIAAVAFTALTFLANTQRANFFESGPGAEGALFMGIFDENAMRTAGTVLLVLAYGLIIGAFYIDLGRIRKERKIFNASMLNNRSKEARKIQKQLKAEQREQEKEAAEKFEAAKAAEEEKRANGLFSRLFKGKAAQGDLEESSQSDSESANDKEESK